MCVLNKLAVSCALSKKLIGKEVFFVAHGSHGSDGGVKRVIYTNVLLAGSIQDLVEFTRLVHTTSTKEVG